jgi:hypothetical protein
VIAIHPGRVLSAIVLASGVVLFAVLSIGASSFFRR